MTTTTTSRPRATLAVTLTPRPVQLPELAARIAHAYLGHALAHQAPDVPCPTSRQLRRQLGVSRQAFAQGMRALIGAGLHHAAQTPAGWHVHVTIPQPAAPLRLEASRRDNVRLTIPAGPDGWPDAPAFRRLLDAQGWLAPGVSLTLDLAAVTSPHPFVLDDLRAAHAQGRIPWPTFIGHAPVVHAWRAELDGVRR